MGFRELTVIEQREEFVLLALAPRANVSALARRFGIARSKAYQWIGRYKAEGRAGLAERSRRPKASPRRSPAATESAVLAIRAESNNAWGGRKIARVLEREGHAMVPSPSTVTAILRRHGKLEERAHEHPGPWRRFEHAAPNDLWQMDFKGHFAMKTGRCHPLSVLDDHSRYAICLEACARESAASVEQGLTAAFRRHGLPHRILCDNGSPWGASGEAYYTGFAIWIIRLGIGLSHGRVRHPQTQGKDERFHRSLKAEVVAGHSFDTLAQCQAAFDRWRIRYNHERPHQALDLAVPAERYRVSPRVFPEILPAIDYGPDVLVRKVNAAGCIALEYRSWCVGRGFVGEPLGLRADTDGRYGVYYCAHHLGDIDLRLLPKGASSPLIKPQRAEGYPHYPRSSQAGFPQEEKQKEP
jgi:transposase InsO family protein